MNSNFRNFALWAIIALLLIALFQLFQNPSQRSSTRDIAFSQFLDAVEQGQGRGRDHPGPADQRSLL